MARPCSDSGHGSHNSQLCPNRGLRLFGVRITEGFMQKSASTGNLALFERSPAAGGSSPDDHVVADDGGSGYVSEGFNGGSGSRAHKKGVPWTEQEHKMFLRGLKKLGKGDWRGISRNYVVSRTPTQVASHAQKYFIRHNANNRRKKRVSLFDIVPDEAAIGDGLLPSSGEHEQAELEKDLASALPTPPATMKYSYPPPVYPIFSTDFSRTIPYMASASTPAHEIVKPMAVYSTGPIDTEELFGISGLSLRGFYGEVQPLIRTAKLVGRSEQQSAFRAGDSRFDSIQLKV